jgi:hypothetical protein
LVQVTLVDGAVVRIVQLPFPVELASQLLLWVAESQPYASVGAITCTILTTACPSAFGSECTVFSIVSGKVHQHCCIQIHEGEQPDQSGMVYVLLKL